MGNSDAPKSSSSISIFLLIGLTTKMASLARVGSEFSIALDFNVDKLGPDFMWFNPPAEFRTRQNGSSGMKVVPVSTYRTLYTFI